MPKCFAQEMPEQARLDAYGYEESVRDSLCHIWRAKQTVGAFRIRLSKCVCRLLRLLPDLATIEATLSTTCIFGAASDLCG